MSLYFALHDDMAISIMAFIGGFVDAAGYIQLEGVFTSSITGNLVVACASIYNTYGVLCRALVTIFFFVGTCFATAISLRIKTVHQFSPSSIALSLFGFEIAVVLIATIVGITYNDDIVSAASLSDFHTILMGSMLGFSMGVHNAVGKECIPNCPSLTVITMTIVTTAQTFTQSVTYMLAKYSLITFSPKPVESTDEAYKRSMIAKFDQSRDKLNAAGNPLISFLVGSLIGAVTMKNFNFYCLIVVLFFLSIIFVDILIKKTFPAATWSSLWASWRGNYNSLPKVAESHSLTKPESNAVIIEMTDRAKDNTIV